MDNRTTCVKVYTLTTLIGVGDKAEDGSRLHPYIVVFGEYVDSMNVAVYIIYMADFPEKKPQRLNKVIAEDIFCSFEF